jgi:hypothetical protein
MLSRTEVTRTRSEVPIMNCVRWSMVLLDCEEVVMVSALISAALGEGIECDLACGMGLL